MKQSDYEQEFAQAMQTKLRLNREARSQVTETSQDASAQSDNNGATELRNSIVAEAMADNPDLTEETALEMLEELGL